MTREAADHRIALFIDFENLVTRTGIPPETFDLQPALDQLLEKGKVVYRRAYCDWNRFMPAKRHLHDLGVELIDVPPSTRSGKNGADMRMVIDALELAYQREHVDTFVIASGDSDFCPLAYKLRENNRTVIGLGVKMATSPLFVRACDEFLYLRPAKAPHPERVEAPRATGEQPASPGEAKERRSRRGGKAAASGEAARPERAEKPQKAQKAQKPAATIPEIARESAAAILARATEPVNQSAISEAIVRRQPDFDVREHGFSTFSRLLEAMEKEGLLKREKSPRGQWYVVPA
jgi:uncharacterized LabA/DUF88 family protein